jgi:DUF1016 N-terminal domain
MASFIAGNPPGRTSRPSAQSSLISCVLQIARAQLQDVLIHRRAEYGAEIVAAVGRQLEARFGRAFGEKSLHRMVQFADAFPDAETVAALRRQLGWTHFKALIPLKVSLLKRDFYAEMPSKVGARAPPLKWSQTGPHRPVPGVCPRTRRGQ